MGGSATQWSDLRLVLFADCSDVVSLSLCAMKLYSVG